ncbi:MAG: hypothetical protein D6728_16110 [Cyanobacteria bacterium J055]|nr:MAG: hypothetical protein D6728_16110 [Cyanobacteria bacterium J055]
MTQDRLDRIEALIEQFIKSSQEQIKASDERMARLERESEERMRASDERMTRLERDIGDLRASISDLRDIVVGHEKRTIRLEGRDIDLWGDYLTVADRIRVLEEWKRQQERDRPSEEK